MSTKVVDIITVMFNNAELYQETEQQQASAKKNQCFASIVLSFHEAAHVSIIGKCRGFFVREYHVIMKSYIRVVNQCPFRATLISAKFLT